MTQNLDKNKVILIDIQAVKKIFDIIYKILSCYKLFRIYIAVSRNKKRKTYTSTYNIYFFLYLYKSKLIKKLIKFLHGKLNRCSFSF